MFSWRRRGRARYAQAHVPKRREQTVGGSRVYVGREELCVCAEVFCRRDMFPNASIVNDNAPGAIGPAQRLIGEELMHS